jgi:hypothetical protein
VFQVLFQDVFLVKNSFFWGMPLKVVLVPIWFGTIKTKTVLNIKEEEEKAF